MTKDKQMDDHLIEKESQNDNKNENNFDKGVLDTSEYIIKLFIHGKDAYRNLSFEREAYGNENDFEYLKNRKPYSWIKYL